MTKLDTAVHFLVPKHVLLSEDEVKNLLKTYFITKDDLPKIKLNDPGIASLGPKLGDVVQIERESKLGGKVLYYRLVE